MNENIKIPKDCNYSIEIEYSLEDDPFHKIRFNVFAKTRSKARYKAFLHLKSMEFELEYSDFIKWGGVSIKKVGQPLLRSLFQDLGTFNRVKENRGLDFLELGMKVLVYNKNGYVVGGNNNANLNVYFPEKDAVFNCHPWDNITYYDVSGNEVAAYN